MGLKRLITGSALAVLTLPCAVYLVDWAIWHTRQTRGSGMSTVSVSRVVVAPLKGGKEEYYPDGTTELDCSRSLFPQAGSGACWWLRRHAVVFDR